MTTCTGAGVDVFRLLSLKGMLKLEKVGLKQRGGALRPRIAAEFGLSPRATHDAFIAAIEAKVAATQLEPGDITA